MSSCLNEMYCLTNICYVCLEKKSKLVRNINSPSVNEDLIHIIDYLPVNLAWLKTKQSILICEECCLQLRVTCQFLENFLKNSALLQAYMDNLNTTSISNTENEAELLVKLNITHRVTDEVKCEIQSEDEEIYKFQWQPNIEETENVFVDFEDSLIKEGIICKKEIDEEDEDEDEEYPTANNNREIIEQTEDVFVNLEDYFVKEENAWKQDEVDVPDEYPMDDNFTEIIDNELDPAISINDNTHVTNADCVSSGFTCKQVHTISKNDLNTAVQKSACSKSYIAKTAIKLQSPVHTDGKSYECTTCKKRFSSKRSLVRHLRIHTDKLYTCSECQRCFTHQSYLVRHMRIHTGEKPYACSKCKKCFTDQWSLARHKRIHTGEKPYECSVCEKCFNDRANLRSHMRIHTGEKPYECSVCKKCFNQHSNLVTHMRIHEKPYKCSNCEKCFTWSSQLIRHMRKHAGKKP